MNERIYIKGRNIPCPFCGVSSTEGCEHILVVAFLDGDKNPPLISFGIPEDDDDCCCFD